MANPYHDETGRFCSRDLMLTSIHNLAVAGKVEEYIKLKTEFDDIDKGNNVVISKETLASLLNKAGVQNIGSDEVLTQIVKDEPALLNVNYNAMHPEAVAQIVRELSWRKTYEDVDTADEIVSILEEVNYQEDVVYAAITPKSLPYSTISEIVKTHTPELFYTLTDRYADDVFENDKEQFVNVLKTLHEEKSEHQFDNTRHFQIDSMNTQLMDHAETLEDLELVAETIPYEYNYRSQQVGRKILRHPKVTKELALRVLDDEYNSGVENYWTVRRALTKTLQNKSFILYDVKEYTTLYPMVPIKGSAPQAAIDHLNWIKDQNIDSGSSSEGYKNNAQLKVDIYEDNFTELLDNSRKNSAIGSSASGRELQGRIDRAKTFMAQKADYDEFRAHVARLKF